MSRFFRVLGAARWKNQAMAPSKFPAADFLPAVETFANPSVPRDLGLACFSIQPFPHSHHGFFHSSS
jgi:hypothetical protein